MPTESPTARYIEWSLEELRGLAEQLQLPDAMRKSRAELLYWLVDSSARDAAGKYPERAARG